MSQASSLSLGTLHNRIARLSPLRASLLALVCGVITLFAFAPFHIWPVYIVSLSLLVWLVDGARVQTRWRLAVFLRGWFFGFGFTLASMHWTTSPFLVEPEQHLIFIWMPLILLPAGLGLFFGGATLLAGYFWSRTGGRIFMLVASLTLFEYLRGVVFGGFPWNWAGTIWVPGAPLSQIASLIGVLGLSSLTMLLAASPAALGDFRPNGGVLGRIFPVFLSVILFGLGWGWGSQRLANTSEGDTISARLVDVGVSQTDKYPAGQDARRQAASDILVAYLQAMGDDFPDEPRLVIWPEGALPVPLLQDPNALDAVSHRLGDRTLIAGTVRIDRYAQPRPEYYNSLAILTESSSLRGARAIYDKHRLVPFGELAAADFIPFGHTISSWLPSAMQQQASSGFKPGTPPTPMALPSGEQFLPLICYEALFPDLVMRNAGDSDFLVNISIDSWFGGAIGPKQHFVNASYRAIESGRPMLRVANLGKTAAVDGFGREIISNVNSYTTNGWPVIVKDVSMEIQRVNTTYSRFYSYFHWIIISTLCLVSLWYYRLLVKAS